MHVVVSYRITVKFLCVNRREKYQKHGELLLLCQRPYAAASKFKKRLPKGENFQIFYVRHDPKVGHVASPKQGPEQ
jgi:hypothetical protein